MNSSIEKYRRFCNDNEDLPIFLQDWWLDAASGKDNWQVEILEEERSITACLPYVIKTKAFLKSMGIPEYTPFLGPWIRNFPSDNDEITNTIEQLLDKLPKFDKYHVKLSTEIQSATAFTNQGFDKNDCYTYVLESIKDHDAIYSGFKPANRSKIKQSASSIKIIESDDLVALFKICELSMKKNKLDIPFSYNSLERIYKSARDKDKIQILLAEDASEKIHAGALLVWDKNRAYYLMGGSDPALRKHGANTLLIWESIKFCSKHVDVFDFEGSMIEPIEVFFKSFGAKRQPYFLVTKTSSQIIKTAQKVKKMIKG